MKPAREAPAQYVAINTANKTVASVTVETIPAMSEVGERRPRKTKPAKAVTADSEQLPSKSLDTSRVYLRCT